MMNSCKKVKHLLVLASQISIFFSLIYIIINLISLDATSNENRSWALENCNGYFLKCRDVLKAKFTHENSPSCLNINLCESILVVACFCVHQCVLGHQRHVNTLPKWRTTLTHTELHIDFKGWRPQDQVHILFTYGRLFLKAVRVRERKGKKEGLTANENKERGIFLPWERHWTTIFQATIDKMTWSDSGAIWEGNPRNPFRWNR